MANEPYKDKAFLYDMYVQRRMNLTDICKHLKDSYNIEVTPQAIYNWVKKYDLLKFRGKGRSLSTGGQKREKSAAQIEAEKRKREMAKRAKQKRKMMGR
jgi:IS30 family transposase